MYSTDETYQQELKQMARAAIARIAKQYKSRKHRLSDLDEQHRIYHACGWQAAIDVIEEQMIVWGRKEQERTRELFILYDAELKKRVVPHDDEEWDDRVVQLYGAAKAYSEARYAVRFLDVVKAIDYLSTRREALLDEIEDSLCDPEEADDIRQWLANEVCKLRAESAILNMIIYQLAGWMEQKTIGKMIRYYIDQNGEI